MKNTLELYELDVMPDVYDNLSLYASCTALLFALFKPTFSGVFYIHIYIVMFSLLEACISTLLHNILFFEVFCAMLAPFLTDNTTSK